MAQLFWLLQYFNDSFIPTRWNFLRNCLSVCSVCDSEVVCRVYRGFTDNSVPVPVVSDSRPLQWWSRPQTTRVAGAELWQERMSLSSRVNNYYYYCFASAAVDVDSSHVTASSSALWSRFSPPSNLVNRHMLTMWIIVCRGPQSQEGEWARPHLCKLAWHGSWPVWKRFIRDHVWRGRSKPGCRIVGSVTMVWLTTEADDQSSLHSCE